MRNVAADIEALLSFLGNGSQVRVRLNGLDIEVLFEWQDIWKRTIVSKSVIVREALLLDFGSILGEVIERFHSCTKKDGVDFRRTMDDGTVRQIPEDNK